MIYKQHDRSAQNGFTIVELMIATTVLSVILLVGAVVMINIGNLYYKGINQARVQNNVRTLTDELTAHLQLSGSKVIPATSPDGTLQAYCIGGTRYSYVLNKQIGTDSDQSRHVLWRDDNTITGGCDIPNGFLDADPPSGAALHGIEMIAANSRLTAFCIGAYDTATGNCTHADTPYRITVGVAYGATDMLDGVGVETRCIGGEGGQFCAAAALRTNVTRRIVH